MKNYEEELPIRVNQALYFHEKNTSSWDLKKADRWFNKQIDPCRMAERMYKTFVNKSADLAYSKYVKLVPTHYKYLFWKNLTLKHGDYYMDSNKIIRKKPSRKFRERLDLLRNEKTLNNLYIKEKNKIWTKKDL